MKLLTNEILRKLPKLYGQEAKGGEAIAQVKFFTPDAQWTWYITEFDGEDIMFGLVEGFEKELGYVRLSELKELRGPLGLPVERDRYFKPKKLSEIAPELFKEAASESEDTTGQVYPESQTNAE